MDILRGFAIILVVAWHAPAIPQLLGVQLPSWLLVANDFFLPYRMPTLMFLSGLLLPSSLRKSPSAYYWGKFQLIVWPYLIWAFVHQMQYDIGSPLWSPKSWIATGYLWFLFYIACYYVIAPLLAKLPAWIPPGAALLAALILPDGLPMQFAYFAVFFFTGAAVSRHPRVLDLIGSTLWVAIPAGVLAIAFGIVSATSDVQYEAMYVPLSFCGIAATIFATRKFESQRWTKPVRFIGRNSLVFYVTHFPVILAVWWLVGPQLENHIVPASLGLFIVAIAVSWGLALLQRYRPITWLYRAPNWYRPAQGNSGKTSGDQNARRVYPRSADSDGLRD